MTSVSASADDAWALRALLGDVRRALDALPMAQETAEHLVRVVWELLTNLAHVEVVAGTEVRVEIEVRRITVQLPGPSFDSVAGAHLDGATGLDTVAWRLKTCGWSWSHRHVHGTNEVRLEETWTTSSNRL